MYNQSDKEDFKLKIVADLHVHSEHSKHPSEWFLQKIGTQESYTTIDEIYQTAKKNGMTHVTISDHNTIDGALELVKKYPNDTFISCEVTTYFPENGCKIHLLVFGITEQQFGQIDKIRSNIYVLRDYIIQRNIAHSIAHATYSINRKLTIEILEKLLLMFDVFEGINGSRNSMYNQIWTQIIEGMTPEHIDYLYNKYKIKPNDDRPWIKGLTGGSDDHAGLFIGKTYTECTAMNGKDFIQHIKDRKTTCKGRCNNYKSFAYTIYKIACDFSKKKAQNGTKGLWNLLHTIMVDNKPLKLKQWLHIKKMELSSIERDHIFTKFFNEFINNAAYTNALSVDEKIEHYYRNISNLADDYFTNIMKSIAKNIHQFDTSEMIKNISAALLGIFFSIPFFSTLKHMFLDRHLVEKLKKKFIGEDNIADKRILWFSDTIADLNGVSITLKKFSTSAYNNNLPVSLVVSVQNENVKELPPNSINLPPVHSFIPDFYQSYTAHFPSLLKSIEKIDNFNPQAIIVSTPGPVGLIGVFSAWLLGIKCTGIYHTDFTRQSELIINDDSMAGIIKSYMRWFYSIFDEILVPTQEYIRVLGDRGYDISKMRTFSRGVDVPQVDYASVKDLINNFKIPTGISLLYAGRVSKDKSIDFLISVYKKVIKKFPNTNLIIAGDGPELDKLQTEHSNHDRIIFTGRLPREKLVSLYYLADVMVFPSTIDTFGMVILESQICGLPSLVSDIGGPKEIIKDGQTGFILPAHNLNAWTDKIEDIILMIKKSPAQYLQMHLNAKKMVKTNYSWDNALYDILKIEQPPTLNHALSSVA
ncbi:MAG: glycosyltransferase [Elusimicrobia bacterium]|nr:glycosyltransferase [Elusimicrobiota bacterium]